MSADCGTEFTDDRWKAGIAVDRGGVDSHPRLCDGCKPHALEAERQAIQTERERQERELRRQETEKTQAAQRAGSWFSRFRT